MVSKYGLQSCWTNCFSLMSLILFLRRILLNYFLYTKYNCLYTEYVSKFLSVVLFCLVGLGFCLFVLFVCLFLIKISQNEEF